MVKKCCDKDRARIRGGKTAVGKGCCMVNQKGLLCWSNVWAEKIKEDKMQGFLEKTGREDSNYKSACLFYSKKSKTSSKFGVKNKYKEHGEFWETLGVQTM